jgi:hypothetical protein
MQNLRPDYKQSRYFRHYFKDLLRIDDKVWVSGIHESTFNAPIDIPNITTHYGNGRRKITYSPLKYQVSTTPEAHLSSFIDSVNS